MEEGYGLMKEYECLLEEVMDGLDGMRDIEDMCKKKGFWWKRSKEWE